MKIIEYQNGNSTIQLYGDGTRVIEFEDVLKLDYPLNLDIRVSTRCAFGFNPKTGTSFCDFCHESARTDGKECDYELLKGKVSELPKGIELAIGANQVTDGLMEFIYWSHFNGYIVNLTVNQGHIKRDHKKIKKLLEDKVIMGLGVSFRSSLKWDIPEDILTYSNTVFHVIAGIDSFEDIRSLSDHGVKKILILGEKDFGFNEGKVDLSTKKHREIFWWLPKLFTIFEVVSFDNLSLEQLNVKRLFTDKSGKGFNQGEHSFYINAVEGYFSPSSRSNKRTNWDDTTVKEYFKTK